MFEVFILIMFVTFLFVAYVQYEKFIGNKERTLVHLREMRAKNDLSNALKRRR